MQVDDLREFKMDGAELSIVCRPGEIMPNPGPCGFCDPCANCGAKPQVIAMSKEEAAVEIDKHCGDFEASEEGASR